MGASAVPSTGPMNTAATRLIRLDPCADVTAGSQRLATALEGADARRGSELAAASFLRIEQPVDAGDPLAWLRGFGGIARLYWGDREGAFEFAGAGTAASVEGDDVAVLEPFLERVATGETATSIRVFGTTRFDLERTPDAEWTAFKRAWFNLPLLEQRREGDQHLLAVNLRVGDAMQSGWFDVQRRTARKALLSGVPVLRAPVGSAPQGEDDDPTAWSARIAALLAGIERGDLEKAVLARRRSHVHDADPLDVLQLLRSAQPAAYPFLVQPTSDEAFLGASPERLYRRIGRTLETEALAGTRPRGCDPAADEALGRELLASGKDRVEHDLVRRHLEQRLRPLTEDLTATGEPELYRLAGLHHLRTPIHARLKPGVGDAALLAALHPTPAVCGTPTEAARQLLRRAEPFDRGLYAGPLGCFGREASEVAVALRCALLRGHWVQLFAGAGIVVGSDADAEWQETVDKMRTIEQALGASDAS